MVDYSQVCQGWIYCITNKVNGKMYIGKTNNFERRKVEHFHTYEECCILRRAFEKYGKTNFEMQSLLTFKAINKEVLNKVMIWLEIYYIAKYNTKVNGYNATYGGEGLSGYKHKEETKIKIGKARKGIRPSEESRKKMSLSNRRIIGKMSERAVLLYDLQGNFTKEYNSIVTAVKEVVGLKESSTAEKALRCPTSQAYGYLWRYKEFDNFPKVIPPYVNPRSKTVYYYTRYGELLGIYSCPEEAARQNNLAIKTVRCSINNRKRRTKWALSNYFSYESPKKEGVN